MPEQLVIYIDHYEGDFAWQWPDGATGRGDLAALADTLAPGNHQALLLVGGPQVSLRQLSYAEREKKHLKRLLPFQLEEAVIGDITQFHIALGGANDGQVSVAYTEKSRLKALFETLAGAGIEVVQCVPAALLLPLPVDDTDTPTGWALHQVGAQTLVRHGQSAGFAVDQDNLAQALSLLLNAENRVDSLPTLRLSADTDVELASLTARLPVALKDAGRQTHLTDIRQFSPANGAIDLCQGEFSQRLPIERWWRAGRALIIGAAVALVVYLATLILQIYQLEDENLETRRQIEQVFRTVVANGPANDPERRLNIMMRDLQPEAAGSAAVALLAQVLPLIDSAGDVSVRGVYYTAENGELSLNVQAGTFNAIETLRGSIAATGLEAELLTASAQGNNHSARIKVTRTLP